MSAFTRLYYANRGLGSHGGADDFDRRDDAFHHTPGLAAAPDDPYRIPDRVLNPDMARPQANSRHPRDATFVRLSG
jgi:hypothetical protein